MIIRICFTACAREYLYGHRFNSYFYWEVPIDQDDTRSRSIENYFIYYGTGIEDLTVEVVNSNSFTVLEPLIEDTTYFWKVVARDDDGGETQTETWSFLDE